jgi:hypothetical protein
MNSHSTSGNSGIDDTILKQSTELAKRACKIESLERTITGLKTEKAMIEIERNNAKKETADLSNVVRSLQNVTSGMGALSDRETKDDDDDSSTSSDESEDEEIVLTPETALDLTLGNLKEHIELLEDGLQASSSLNQDQKMAIDSLEKDAEAQNTKITKLEQLFSELNANDRLVYQKSTDADDDEKDSGSEGDDSEKKADSDSSSSEGREKNSRKFAIRMPTVSMPSMSMPSVSMPSVSMPTVSFPKVPARKERHPKIPAKAAAAACAAAILVSHDENQENQPPAKTDESASEGAGDQLQNPAPKKKKKTTMKKVKIRFKKAGLEGTYTGPLVDKKPHGVGTIRFTNGDTYLGEMTRGKMSGSGTLYTKSKGIFRGRFENNRFVGELQDEDADDEHSSSERSGGTNPASDDETESTNHKDLESTEHTSTTVAMSDEEEEAAAAARANRVAALELDAHSPTTITGSQDIGIDESFKMANLDGMQRRIEDAEYLKEAEREENESFLREFSGSEHSEAGVEEEDDYEPPSSFDDLEPPPVSTTEPLSELVKV